ncbi:hypothetical protein QTP88_005860 [Uroleucon formosanum]
MALRGHRDSGNILKTFSDDKQNNDGNFRAILRYRAQGDSDMRSYLESSGTIKYTSSTSQNEIIDSCNKVLLNKIVSRVNEAKCFSVLADETADVSGIEQVSLCVRYVELNTLKLHEDFLQFVPAVDMTGKGLAKLIIDNLQHFGIDTTYLRGQGYDGAASMSGKFNGVQAHIKDTHPLAIYVHCSAHVLNLVVSKSCSVTQIRDCLATLGKVRDFFIFPKRKSILRFHIENSSETSTKKSLKRSCETRWIERFHAINDFIELYEYVIEALDTISEWDDNDTSNKARSLRSSILDIEFLISLFVLNKGFSIGLPLSKFLQKSNIDLKLAVQLANDTKKELQELRTHVDDVFKKIFEEVKVVAEKFDIEIKIPRLSKKQTNRSNIPLNTPEQYYRASILIPYLDKFITELEERFNVHRSILSGFDSLFRENGPIEDIIILSNKYNADLQNDGTQNEIIEAEYKLWQRKLMQTTEKPNNALEAMAMCNQSIYPNIFKLLQILVTLPVSSATNERTFSNLKRIKTYLRNSMSEKFIYLCVDSSFPTSLTVQYPIIVHTNICVMRKIDNIISSIEDRDQSEVDSQSEEIIDCEKLNSIIFPDKQKKSTENINGKIQNDSFDLSSDSDENTEQLETKETGSTILPLQIDILEHPPLRLKSRAPIWHAETQSESVGNLWTRRWEQSEPRNKDLIKEPFKKVPGWGGTRAIWTMLNRIRTKQGRCNYLLHKWGMIDSPLCECGETQTIKHRLSRVPSQCSKED